MYGPVAGSACLSCLELGAADAATAYEAVVDQRQHVPGPRGIRERRVDEVGCCLPHAKSAPAMLYAARAYRDVDARGCGGESLRRIGDRDCLDDDVRRR